MYRTMTYKEMIKKQARGYDEAYIRYGRAGNYRKAQWNRRMAIEAWRRYADMPD